MRFHCGLEAKKNKKKNEINQNKKGLNVAETLVFYQSTNRWRSG